MHGASSKNKKKNDLMQRQLADLLGSVQNASKSGISTVAAPFDMVGAPNSSTHGVVLPNGGGAPTSPGKIASGAVSVNPGGPITG